MIIPPYKKAFIIIKAMKSVQPYQHHLGGRFQTCPLFLTGSGLL